MFAILHFGCGVGKYQSDGYVACDKIISLDCSNENKATGNSGGIGDIVVHAANGRLWTGEVHLRADTFCFHFGNVVKIETCDKAVLWHDDWYPCHLLWQYDGNFSYEQYYQAAELLLEVLK